MEELKEIYERIEDCVHSKVSSGLDNVDSKELGMAIDMMKDLICAMKDMSIVIAMENDSDGYKEHIPELK